MPIHFDDLDVMPELAGLHSALIVPCNMCPAVTVAVREERPFMRLYRSFLKSAPFTEYIRAMQDRLLKKGIRTEVFESNIYHQWFMCMWTAGRQKKLRKHAKQHDAVIVLGCDSATETVRDSVRSTGCRVVEGMRVTGIMNAKLSLRWPGDICFADYRTIPIAGAQQRETMIAAERRARDIPRPCFSEPAGDCLQQRTA